MPDLETLDVVETELSDAPLEGTLDDTLLLADTEETDGEADPLASLDDDSLVTNPRVAALLAKEKAEREAEVAKARADTEYRIRQSERDRAEAAQYKVAADLEEAEGKRIIATTAKQRFAELKAKILDGDDTADIDEQFLDELAEVSAARGRVRVSRKMLAEFQKYAEARMPGFMRSVPQPVQENYWRAVHAGDDARALLYVQDAMLAAQAAAVRAQVLAELEGTQTKEAQAKAAADAAKGARREAATQAAPSRPANGNAPRTIRTLAEAEEAFANGRIGRDVFLKARATLR